jgi:hypothetical protein
VSVLRAALGFTVKQLGAYRRKVEDKEISGLLKLLDKNEELIWYSSIIVSVISTRVYG